MNRLEGIFTLPHLRTLVVDRCHVGEFEVREGTSDLEEISMTKAFSVGVGLKVFLSLPHSLKAFKYDTAPSGELTNVGTQNYR